MGEVAELVSGGKFQSGIEMLSNNTGVCSLLNRIAVHTQKYNGDSQRTYQISESQLESALPDSYSLSRVVKILTYIEVLEESGEESSYKINRKSEILDEWKSLNTRIRELILDGGVESRGIDYVLYLISDETLTASSLYNWLDDEYTEYDALDCVISLSRVGIITRTTETTGGNDPMEKEYVISKTGPLSTLGRLDTAIARQGPGYAAN